MPPYDPPRPVVAPEPLPEGAEAPPPGVRLMASVRWALVALMAALAVVAWAGWAGAPSPAAAAHRAVQYQCPMHPTVLQTAPGACPVCGMDLVPAAHGAGAAAVPPADDGAHPAATTGPAAGPGKYWCPMHPDVHGDDPEARCEKCGGMKLVPRQAVEPAPRHQDVEGLAPVELGAERSQRAGVRTAPVERRPLGATLRTVGVVTVDETAVATVSARVTGWVEELLVKEGGGRVRKGQALATVYSPELLSAQQAILAAPPPAPGQGQGAKSVTVGAFGLDLAKRLELLGMAQEDVDALRQTGQLRYAQPVRSPLDGYVSRRGAFAGQYVQPGVELFQIVDLSRVWLLVDVREDELPLVRAGQRARLTVASRPGETFTGRVEYLYPSVNPDSRTLKARVALVNPGLALRPGMVGDVVLEGAPVDGLVVPAEAVVDTGDRRYVFVAREAGRFEPRLVRTGLRADDLVQVLEGVADGERVVTTAGFLVDSESRLRAAVAAFSSPPAAR